LNPRRKEKKNHKKNLGGQHTFRSASWRVTASSRLSRTSALSISSSRFEAGRRPRDLHGVQKPISPKVSLKRTVRLDIFLIVYLILQGLSERILKEMSDLVSQVIYVSKKSTTISKENI
jgi:hypothetical protein